MNSLSGPSMGLDKILPALAKVKTQLKSVSKGTNNPFFKSKYADLNTYLDEVEPLLEQNGMVLLQPVTATFGGSGLENIVTSKIYHVESGQSVESSMKLVAGTDMQKMGSGVTYARRYTLGSLLSMQAVDDDGEGVMERNPKPVKVTAAEVKETRAKNPDMGMQEAKAAIAEAARETKTAVTTAKTEVAKPTPANRPSFRRPAKTETSAPVNDSGHGEDI